MQVADSWFVEDLRGLQGTIAAYPEELDGYRNASSIWVEFDEVWPSENPVDRTDAAEIDAEHLILL